MPQCNLIISVIIVITLAARNGSWNG